MLTISPNTRISLCTSPVDMRKGFNGLIGIVRSELAADPFADHLFVFLKGVPHSAQVRSSSGLR